jgi:SAM-dependent methyltransferase
MKPEEDAYGQEMWACHNGEGTYEIVERDDGYIDIGPDTKVYFSRYEEWSPHEKKAMEFVKGRVLDIGCGPGRHSLYLQDKGFDVLGIDVSPLAIKVCKLRGLKKAEVMSIEEVDFKPNSFDTIIMMGNNFGLFGNPKRAKRLLKKFHKMTSKNTLIIADTRDPYKTENPFHLEYQKFNRKRGRMSGQLRIRIRYKKYTTKWFDYLIVSKEEMKEILRGTGWKIKEFLDSRDSGYITIMEKEMKE